jgi:hypothetical protein
MEQMTSEQRNELQLKKMTLDLDLTATQQKRWAKLLPSKALKEARMTERKANKDTTKIQLTAMKSLLKSNARQQIVMKERMKKFFLLI